MDNDDDDDNVAENYTCYGYQCCILIKWLISTGANIDDRLMA